MGWWYSVSGCSAHVLLFLYGLARMVIVECGFKMMDTSARVYIFAMVPKWNMAVKKLVARKEQKSHPMRYLYFRNQRVEEAQYTKFWQIVIPRRFHTKSRVTSRAWRATFGMESAENYDLLKFGILGLLDALKIYLKSWDFLFLTSYKPCNSQVPLRHHYKNVYAFYAIDVFIIATATSIIYNII